MSTFYYLACKRHRVYMDDVLTVRHFRGFDLDGRDEPPRGEITAFIAEHITCGPGAIRVLDEHEIARYAEVEPKGLKVIGGQAAVTAIHEFAREHGWEIDMGVAGEGTMRAIRADATPRVQFEQLLRDRAVLQPGTDVRPA